MNFWSSFFLIADVAIVAVQSTKETLRPPRKAIVSLLCHVTIEYVSSGEIEFSKHTVRDNHRYVCNPVTNGVVSDFSYNIDLPHAFANENTDAILAGTLFARIPGGEISHGAIAFPSHSIITVGAAPDSFHARQRHLASSVGTRSLLILRISANDATPGYTADEIYNFIFDESDPINVPSLKAQYKALSFGKLTFEPTEHGVLEVQVDMDANGASSDSIRDAAINAVQSQFGVSSITLLADNVILCVPPGTGDWSGNASINSWRIVLNDQWCGYLSGLMHEMGHNFGLLHSNMYGIQYMDFTSYMSAGIQAPYYPVKSFNGANNWRLGWYSDRQLIIDPSQGGQMVTLATFVDYGKSNKNNPVLIMVGTDLFLQYNRAKDFNYQTQANIDQVTVAQQFVTSGTSLLGGVDLNGPQMTIANFNGSGQNLIIYACSSGTGNDNDPDWMVISIGYDRNFCVQDTAVAVAPAPTVRPRRRRRTIAPSTAPSMLMGEGTR